MQHDSVVWLLAILTAPGLLALMLLMEWLESHFARRMVADEVTVALSAARTPEELEAAVARSVARLFPEQR